MNRWLLHHGFVAMLCGMFFLFSVGSVESQEKVLDDSYLPFGPATTDVKKATLTLLTAEERSWDGRPALALLFSDKLDSTRIFDNFISVFGPNNELIPGGWVLAKDLRTLLFPGVNPQTTYTVKIQPGFPATARTVFGKTAEKSVTTRKLLPAYTFVGKGLILPTGLTDGLPIMTVNVPEVDVEFLRVNDESIGLFLDRFSWTDSGAHWDNSLRRISPHTKSLFMSRFVTGLKTNQRGVTHIPVENIPQLQKPGLYIAVMSRAGQFGKFKTTQFVVSDIGLHLRYYQENMVLYANSLKSGKPLSDLKITVLNKKGKELAHGVSDSIGRVKLPLPKKNTGVVVARKGSDITLLALKDPALDLSEFQVAGAPFQIVEPFVYSPRDLYRPGEVVEYSILLRDYDGKPTPEQPLSVRIKQPDGKEVFRQTLTAIKLGYYQGSTQLPGEGQTGRWSLEVWVDPAAKKPDRVFKFSVEEFLPERMKLTLTAPKSPALADEKWPLLVAGSYLHGASADGNRLKVAASWKKADLLPEWPKFHFGNISDKWKMKRSSLFDGPLDKLGKKSLDVPTIKEKLQSPLRLKMVVDLFETGGRPVTRSISRYIWPSKTMVGVRPLFDGKYAKSNSEASFEVIKIKQNGELLSGEALDVQVIHESRNYYWAYNESGGWNYRYSKSDYPIFKTSLSFAQNKKGILRIPVTYGAYRLEVVDPGTGTKMVHRFHAGWDWKDRQQTSQPRPERVNLQLDKKNYHVGDVAQLNIIPPQPGEGLVLVESSTELLWGQRINLPKEGRKVAIPIQKEWKSHDIYISVLSFRPGDAKDKITPNRSLGLIHLALNRDDRRLPVKLILPKQIAPNGPLKIAVHLENHNNQPAMVTVAAVDVGVLNITEMKTPDPFDRFFSKRGFGVEAKDIYSKVIENQEGVLAKQKFGGDAPNKRREGC
jgi:alpha-2-macroglobulin